MVSKQFGPDGEHEDEPSSPPHDAETPYDTDSSELEKMVNAAFDSHPFFSNRISNSMENRLAKFGAEHPKQLKAYKIGVLVMSVAALSGAALYFNTGSNLTPNSGQVSATPYTPLSENCVAKSGERPVPLQFSSAQPAQMEMIADVALPYIKNASDCNFSGYIALLKSLNPALNQPDPELIDTSLLPNYNGVSGFTLELPYKVGPSP